MSSPLLAHEGSCGNLRSTHRKARRGATWPLALGLLCSLSVGISLGILFPISAKNTVKFEPRSTPVPVYQQESKPSKSDTRLSSSTYAKSNNGNGKMEISTK